MHKKRGQATLLRKLRAFDPPDLIFKSTTKDQEREDRVGFQTG